MTHKLEFAGGNDILVDPDAMKILCESSQGIARTVDHIMTEALSWGVQMKHSTIDAEIMQRAVDSQSLI